MSDLPVWTSTWLSRIEPYNLEIRPLAAKTYIPQGALFSRNPVEIGRFIEANKRHHLFFGVLGRDGNVGDKEHVHAAHCLWVDIDWKDLKDGQAEADAMLSVFEHRPSLVVDSGGGYHAYWFLEEPATDFPRVERILKGLAVRLRADTQAAEIARILRVPGSTNWKYDPPRLVKVASYSPESTYSLEDFAEWEHDEATKSANVDAQDWFKEGRRDKDMHYLGCCLARGGAPRELARNVIVRAMNSWGENDLKWAETKVESAYKTVGKVGRNVAEDVREFVMSTNGVFLSTEVAKCLQLSTREDQKNISVILRRMADEGVITRAGAKNGTWRRIDTEYEPMVIDLDAPDEEEFSIKLPFLLSDMVEIYPRNVLVVAGEKDAGKTCFALNVAYLNRDNMKVRYLNSEMGRVEIKKRLRKFPFPHQEWKKIEFIERSSDFADLILPDALNIVDFLEIYENHFLIAGMIKSMFDRLRGGVLLVLLQKRTYKDLGSGGEASLEKARFYLNLRRGGTAQIKSAKNWRRGMGNPRDLVCEYSIRNGGELTMTKHWYMPEEEAAGNVRSFKRRGPISTAGVSDFVHED